MTNDHPESSPIQKAVQLVTNISDFEYQINQLGNARILEPKRFTDWEKQFLDSFLDRWMRWGIDTHLSLKQLEILERIYKQKASDIPGV